MDDEALRLAVYSTLAATGRAPDRDALARELRVDAADVDAGMERLAAARHVVLGSAGDVVLAHPFATSPLGFAVMGERTLWWGGCAWDSSQAWDDVVRTCSNQRLFCSTDCVDRWLSASGHERGYVMDLATLWRLARSWYDGRLRPGYQRREPAQAREYFRDVGLDGPFWGLDETAGSREQQRRSP